MKNTVGNRIPRYFYGYWSAGISTSAKGSSPFITVNCYTGW